VLYLVKRGYHPHLCNYSGIYPIREGKCHPSSYSFSSFSSSITLVDTVTTHTIKMSYNILGSGYRPNITLFSFDSTSAKIHKVSDSKAPENASWLEPGKEGVIYSTSEVPNGEVYSLKLQGEELEITGKRSTKGEEPAHGT
jgi:6-phosphogluconolactonase (cycloisomerase 2 family)